MIPSTKLLRYGTYQGNNISECRNCTRYYDTAEYSYTLEIHADIGNFTLSIEPGEIIIKDCLRTIEDRSYLYEGMEDGKIFNWLLEEWNCIQHVNEEQEKVST